MCQTVSSICESFMVGHWRYMILYEPLFLIGEALFSYFIYTAPQDCPEKYMKLRVMGGNLENRGDIHRYCNMELRNGFYKWTLKEGE